MPTTPDQFLDYFDKHYRERLSAYRIRGELANRYVGFRAMFDYLLQEKNSDFTIVETGTLRNAGHWPDGQSSYVFRDFIEHFGGKLITIDISAENMLACQTYLQQHFKDSERAQVQFTVADAVVALQKIQEPVDLIYLDSYDFDPHNPMPSMLHHMKELLSCQKILAQKPNVLVGVDDNFKTPELRHGKGYLVKEWVKQVGYKVLLDDYQFIFEYRA